MNFHATGRFFPVPAGNGLHLEKNVVKILFLFENLGPSGGFRRPSGAARETIMVISLTTFRPSGEEEKPGPRTTLGADWKVS
jgi:hypothetical protein